jgi:hypothetical protein
VGAPAAVIVAAETVMVNTLDVEAAFLPLCAKVRRPAAARLSETIGAAASETRPVKVNTPATVGVPVMAPVFALRFNPFGSVPPEMEYV